MNKNTISTMLAIFFMLLTLGGYFYLWSSSNKETATDNSAIEQSTTGVADISGIKEQAQKLTSGKENNAGIPIPEPTGKLSNANPFAAR